MRPPSRFGGLDFAETGHVRSFTEKPQIGEGWINGGFFVLEPKVLDYIDGDAIPFEHALERLAAEGQLVAYKHDEFWQCMDCSATCACSSLWQSGKAPWKVWNDDE